MTDSASPQAMFELFQKMANPFAFPLQNFLMPGLSLEEVEKKISELQAVHAWLQTSLGVLDVSLKSLEYQKALLSPSTSEPEKTSPADNPFLDPKNWPWNFLKTEESASSDPTTDKPRKKKTTPE
jgi:hypothetical protein